MVALVSTVAYLGLEARSVEVQCQIAPGLPRFPLSSDLLLWPFVGVAGAVGLYVVVKVLLMTV